MTKLFYVKWENIPNGARYYVFKDNSGFPSAVGEKSENSRHDHLEGCKFSLAPIHEPEKNTVGFRNIRIHDKTVVVCAANRCEKIDTVFCGVRHGDPFMIAQMTAVVHAILGRSEYSTSEWHEIIGFQEQGFVDNRYNFLTREEAMIVAKEAGQKICLRGCGGHEDVLFSEGLY